MSLISKQIEELRAYAKDRKGELAKLINDAADTIEVLSAKLHASNMERSSQYYNNGWIPCSQMPEYDYMDVLVRWHDKREYCKNDYYLFEGYVVKGEWRGLFSDTDISVLEPVEWTYIKPHKKRCENEPNKQTD